MISWLRREFFSFRLNPPFELKQGDEVRVTCVYRSTHRNSTTYFGEATFDEMCVAFLTYYPPDKGLNFCGQWKGIGLCNNNGDAEFESCEFLPFLYFLVSLNTSCAENCSSSNCTMLLDDLSATGCMNYADVRSFSQVFLYSYYALFLRCASSEVTSETTMSFDITTTPSLHTRLSSHNPITSTSATNYTSERSSQNTLRQDNSTTSAPNHSSERKAVFAHSTLLSLVVYATSRLVL